MAPVNRTVPRLPWFRFRSTLGRQRNGYPTWVKLIGLAAGLTGAIAGAGAGPEG